MNAIVERNVTLPAMTEDAIEKVRSMEAFSKQLPQVEIITHHVIHAGMYARTIVIPKGVMLTGVLIKIPTILIFSGSARVFIGDTYCDLVGLHVLPGSAGRKQAFITYEDTELTMVFPTKAKTVEEAESEFTDEVHMLFSRGSDEKNVVIITGE